MTIPRNNFIHKINETPKQKVSDKVSYNSLNNEGEPVDGKAKDAPAYSKTNEYGDKEFYFKVNQNGGLFDPHFKESAKIDEKISMRIGKTDKTYSYAKGNSQAYEYYRRYLIDRSVGMLKIAQQEFTNSQQTTVKDYVVMSEIDSYSSDEQKKMGIIQTTQPVTSEKALKKPSSKTKNKVKSNKR